VLNMNLDSVQCDHYRSRLGCVKSQNTLYAECNSGPEVLSNISDRYLMLLLTRCNTNGARLSNAEYRHNFSGDLIHGNSHGGLRRAAALLLVVWYLITLYSCCLRSIKDNKSSNAAKPSLAS